MIFHGRHVSMLLSCRLSRPLLTQSRRYDITRRNLLTSPVEPPLTMTERPCGVVLAEDALYAENSWKTVCENRFPNVHGMSFRNFSWPLSAKEELDMDFALAEMSRDLSSNPQTLLIARGPWLSWMALFYLESLPLAGLVLVDPLPLDHVSFVNQMELAYAQHQDSIDYQLFQEYSEHWSHWTLQLEPGAVPMLVVSTTSKSVWRKAAQATADRHSGPVHGAVPVVELMDVTSKRRQSAVEAEQESTYGELVVDALADWMEDRVL